MFKGFSIPAQEDLVEYCVYRRGASLEDLGVLCEDCHASVAGLIPPGFLWEEDCFRLAPRAQPGPPHLWGLTRFGQNINDEWFIVHLLLRLSHRFPDLLISLHDSDGEFLLIEAALSLPKWLNPETSRNRIWISNGTIHIIPLPKNPTEMLIIPDGEDLDVARALEIVGKKLVRTEANQGVQEAIGRRAEEAREEAGKSAHYARCRVPRDIAYLLQERPQLAAYAVNAYYYRDTIQMKVCRKMERFPARDCGEHVLRLSRCLYAQLLRQELDFVPFGYEAVPPNTPKTALLYKSVSMGHKLASGFEVLYQDLKRNAKKKGQNVNNVHNIPIPNIVETIDELLSREERFLHQNSERNADSDDWLNISPEEVEDIISRKQKELDVMLEQEKKKMEKKKEEEKEREKKGEEGGNSKLPEDNLFDFMVRDINGFIKKVSDMEGVEVDEEGEDEDEEDEDFYMGGDGDEGDMSPEEMRQMFQQMEEELKGTSMNQSFEKSDGQNVDINLNLVKSFLSSYEAQQGYSGPVTNILNKTKKK